MASARACHQPSPVCNGQHTELQYRTFRYIRVVLSEPFACNPLFAEPSQTDVCPIGAITQKLCFSDDDCPFTSEEAGSWVCVTLRPRIEGIPGVCRKVCDADPDTSCPIGQVCTAQLDTAVCVDICPPDGLPPCERVTCGSLQSCTRNWCRTQGALVDPGLCVPPFDQREEDFFCIN